MQKHSVGRGNRPQRKLMHFSFCIAGSQKAATTSLSSMLNSHPGVRRAPRKEMHYFDQEHKNWQEPDFSDLQVRGRSDHVHLGDATPLYMWWPKAMQRIRSYNPHMQFIVTFRDPIDRLFSQWAMNRGRWGHRASDWPEFITRFAPSGLEDNIPEGMRARAYRMESGLVRGYYGEQLVRAYQLFAPEQFHLINFGALLAAPKDHLSALTDFLALPPFDEPPDLPHKMPGKDVTIGTAPTASDIAWLCERYQEDFEQFKVLSRLDVSTWTLQGLIDGTVAPDDVATRYASKVAAPPST